MVVDEDATEMYKPKQTMEKSSARSGTSDTPNDWWSNDTIGYYGEPVAATIIQGNSGNKQKTLLSV